MTISDKINVTYFLYLKLVKLMTIYVEVIFIINFIFDFCLLLTVDLLLKRHITYKRVLVGALVGEISMLSLILKLSNIELFIFKILLSILMSIITFKYKSIKYTLYNTIHLYFSGIILGGFITYIYNEFRINREYSIKYLIILIISPIIFIIYYKITNSFKNNYNNRYKITFDYDNNHFEGIGYLDSGNKLTSPISGKPIILVEKEYIKNHRLKLLPVPYNALNHSGVIYCFKPYNLYINGNKMNNILIGISDIKFHIDGCNVLLNVRMENI